MAGGLIQFSNNTSSKLASPIIPAATSLTVLSGEGAKFPQPSGGTYFYLTLIDANNNIEIVRVTARVNDAMTIVRAQDGTTARDFAAQVYVGMTIPRVVMQALLQDNGGLVSGAYTFSDTVSFSSTIAVSGVATFNSIPVFAVGLTLPPGSGSIAEGRIQWNTGSDLLTVGTGAATKTMVDTNTAQTLTNKTLTSPVLTTPNLAQLGSRMKSQAGVTTGNSGIAAAAASLGEIEVMNNNVGAAMMCFLRSGVFGAYFGIDTDNKWKVGGWSYGAAAYELYHAGNPPPAVVEIPAGTIMLFQQTAAPTGWTKLTNIHDYTLRVTSGTVSAGGVYGVSSVFGGIWTSGGHTLTTAEIPAHAHAFQGHAVTTYTGGASPSAGFSSTVPLFSTSTDGGSGGSHAHSIDMRVLYLDVIRAQKN